MTDDWDSQTWAWSARELAQDFKEFYRDALRDSPVQGQQGVAEAETDYQKRRQRERDIDAGKPVARQPKNPQTDYAKKRAQQKKELELGESTNYWTKLQSERNTKIASLVNELSESVNKTK